MLKIDGQKLTLDEVHAVAYDALQVRLSDAARVRMQTSRASVERILQDEHRTVYGVNTGFGKLADIRIPHDELRQLQTNLVRSHACGVGNALSEAETRAMMLLRANVLALGFSGARFEVAETLIAMLNAGVHPLIPEKGSVGASGDLAPLAHLALVCIGEGEAIFNDEKLNGAEALLRANITALQLEAKEGLALLNGTQAMAAVGGLALRRAQVLMQTADVAGAMTLEALRGTPTAFDERIHKARPHEGQQRVAARLRELLRDSEIRESHREGDPRVQDSYSLRCMPQVHGAARDAFSHATNIVEIETGSATDNPLVFSDEEILSGGNFHGAPLALAFDYAALALTHASAIFERRIERLVNPDLSEGLPAFLTSKPGTSSGFMIAHVTAVALLNEMKVLAHPATADNVPTSAGKEDHVSMGMTAALKLRQIVDNAERILAIELLAAAEGLEYRLPLKPGAGALQGYETVRQYAPRLTQDRALSYDIEQVARAVQAGDFDF